MRKIKEYIFSIIAIAIIGSFALIITPDGEGGGIKKHISLIAGLAAIVVIISPLISVLESLSELQFENIGASEKDSEEYESIFYSSYEAAERENLKNGIKSALYDKFRIDESECAVELTVCEGELARVLIRLYGSAVWRDSGEIESYLGNLLGCEIVTAIG